jgi:hypothetical protein
MFGANMLLPAGEDPAAGSLSWLAVLPELARGWVRQRRQPLRISSRRTAATLACSSAMARAALTCAAVFVDAAAGAAAMGAKFLKMALRRGGARWSGGEAALSALGGGAAAAAERCWADADDDCACDCDARLTGR